MRGRGAAALLKLPFLLARACAQAWRRLADIRPDVVLGMGGYGFPGRRHGSAAPHAAGRARTECGGRHGQPLAGQAGAPRAQRFSRRVAARRALGNPVRADLCALPEPAERYAGRSGALRVLVVGGSLGAHALNTTVPQALALLPEQARPQVVHQAGEQHLPALQQAYAQAGVQADCRAFIDDMADAMAQADLLICRAGAMTVSEVAAAGVAALFVPFPHAIDDHQTANARFLSDAQAAWLQPQASLTPQWLAQWLGQRTRQELQAVAGRARTHALPRAAAHIADVCEQAARRAS